MTHTVARAFLRAGMVIGAALFLGLAVYVVLHLAWTAGGY